MTFGAIDSEEDALLQPVLIEAKRRGLIQLDERRIKYVLGQEKTYDWIDRPEEWVRAVVVSWLVVDRGYPANRIKLEVSVPRRTPSDFADVVVFRDDSLREPYLVVETKASYQSETDRAQWIEQLFGNANSLRVPLGLYEEGSETILFNVADYPSTERARNRLGPRAVLPKEYGNTPTYAHVAAQEGDIAPVPSLQLEAKIRRAHSLIWAGGRRDPLTAFDEWSKLLFAKVMDERTTETGHPRRFQVGTNETVATVANRVHALFRQACATDPTIFRPNTRIELSDAKITEVVRCLQSISFTRTDVDSIGRAFEHFFGSIFRGGLGQYFTMRQLSRFVVAALDVTNEDFVLDPTAGSGGFLLECLLQVWHRIDESFQGQPPDQIQRAKYDFAKNQVYGIEIHEVLARICKINLLLHHDGHTNIEANKSALDSVFLNPRLMPPKEKFTCVVGNPPFGTTVSEGDEEQLGQNRLENFRIAENLKQIDSEQVIIERCIQFLEPGGRFGLILPDGVFNNQGANCPETRALLASHGRILATISLPDHAFRKSGAQNKTSILFFQKYSRAEKRRLDREINKALGRDEPMSTAIATATERAGLGYRCFLGEANHVGYTPAGAASEQNDLYRSSANGLLPDDQAGTILGEWRAFLANPEQYPGSIQPDCVAIAFGDLWRAHQSNRLDPKYHLFKREARRAAPEGWVQTTLGQVLHKREEEPDFSTDPDAIFRVMTISQTGEIRDRVAGKGRSPPEWRAAYFEESPGTWYQARVGDVVYSSIDLWKGCIAVVPDEFDGALVTHEFPIFRVSQESLSAAFLQCLLRSRYYQRAFRAITTGHSNRRRTQRADFEALEIAFPAASDEQLRLVSEILDARASLRNSAVQLNQSLLRFSDLIDGRGEEALPEVEAEDANDE